MDILYLAILAGVVALAFAGILTIRIMKSDEGSEEVQFIGNAIREGAMAFLSLEYRLLAVFVVIVFIVLAVFIDYDLLNKIDGESESVPGTAISYLVGRDRLRTSRLHRNEHRGASQHPHHGSGADWDSTRLSE